MQYYLPIGDKSTQSWISRLNDIEFSKLSDAQKLQCINFTQQECMNLSKRNNLNIYKTSSDMELGVEEIVDSYGISLVDSQVQMYSSYSVGQSFTGRNRILTRIGIYLTNYTAGGAGSFAGNGTMYLYSHSGTFGVSSNYGSLLATSTAVPIVNFSLGVNMTVFTFPTPYTLVSGTRYVWKYAHAGGDFNHVTYCNYDAIRTAGDIGNFINLATPAPAAAAAFIVYGENY